MTLHALLLLAAGTGGVYLDLINDSLDRVVHVEAAAAGTGQWRPVPLQAPLRGGGAGITVRLHGEGCLYDLRFRFNRGPDLLHPGHDACKGTRYRIGAYRRAARRHANP